MVETPEERHHAAAQGRPPKVGFIGWCRLWLRVCLMLLAALVAIPLHYLFRIFRLPSPWPRLFLGWVARIAGARVKRIGVPLKRDVFYISNHVSWIDILAIGGASGSAFVAKAELQKAPLVGWLASLNRTVYVARNERLRVADQINQLREAFHDNWAVTVFPEGTTTDGASLLPFKSPLLKVLEPPPPGVMVQPILLVFDARGRNLSWIGEESGKDNAIRVLSNRGSFSVRCVFLDPFHPRDFPTRKLLAAEAKRRISEAFEERTGSPPQEFIGHDWWAGKRPQATADAAAGGDAE
ncbi:lysophospholipid acyltransferase family protein [Sphingosinithalassobacter sp. CS137]|uniref:lysophospholipid acyltransferase family protein n=1 Tax=Sphingosinithalassobacter sp. CS137 TaxID=2762748 RepID=UPI0021D15BB7|nr:lysophospholipid acyltransferase family protein [Sphingosinithalassobacter sp. CS137]